MFRAHSHRILFGLAVWPVALIALVLSTIPRCADASFIGLGQAGQFGMFCVSNTQWSMNNSVINSNMAAGPGVTFNWSGGAGPYQGPVFYQNGGAVPPVAS